MRSPVLSEVKITPCEWVVIIFILSFGFGVGLIALHLIEVFS